VADIDCARIDTDRMLTSREACVPATSPDA